jgi:hypothetical protein
MVGKAPTVALEFLTLLRNAGKLLQVGEHGHFLGMAYGKQSAHLSLSCFEVGQGLLEPCHMVSMRRVDSAAKD